MRITGELETAIMNVLWSRDQSCTVREVLERLRADRDIAYTTVMTVMNILYTKGWLLRDKQGRAWSYRPVMSREEYSAQLMREALHSSPDTRGVFTHFVSGFNEEESEALRDALTRLTEREH
ncbi:BlaI/MecI/CopY family transcriptional regulator [Hoyosella sp. YIM 151337]|uniref:BlaI/MecI/CopY family transcriptional regulator n=1 Tax=Hoyosella sp. YIM 151337 TaxID=2992742 RepID=UPI002235CBB2|nr:BlaI/MecI/CopY family transcriptional regulator [Hoyosella sp. YIM 151337]MCW4351965.1 BlaI/MecI/CopY family transcriptional regulator [Hoyosella sp. YIM 151337]